MTVKKRAWKSAGEYKVYKTSYNDGTFYIGKWSDKSKIPYDKYFGSNKTDKVISHKETLAVFKKATDAAVFEMLMQLQFRNDENCLNKMINIRTQTTFISGEFPEFDIVFKDKKYNNEEEDVLDEHYHETINKHGN